MPSPRRSFRSTATQRSPWLAQRKNGFASLDGSEGPNGMNNLSRVRWIVVGLVAVHLLMLACYTLPASWVPVRPRYWSQAYSRVLFHQDWRLFAPDPPECPCSLEMKTGPSEGWQPLSDLHAHFIWRRMASNACRYAETCIHPDRNEIILPKALATSLENMVSDLPRTGPIHFRLRRCDDEFFELQLLRGK